MSGRSFDSSQTDLSAGLRLGSLSASMLYTPLREISLSESSSPMIFNSKPPSQFRVGSLSAESVRASGGGNRVWVPGKGWSDAYNVHNVSSIQAKYKQSAREVFTYGSQELQRSWSHSGDASMPPQSSQIRNDGYSGLPPPSLLDQNYKNLSFLTPPGQHQNYVRSAVPDFRTASINMSTGNALSLFGEVLLDHEFGC